MRIARELVGHDDEREAAARGIEPVVEFAVSASAIVASKRERISASNAASNVNRTTPPMHRIGEARAQCAEPELQHFVAADSRHIRCVLARRARHVLERTQRRRCGFDGYE